MNGIASKMRIIRLWLLLVAGLSPAAAQVPSDIEQALRHRGHALLIGVPDYTTGWDQLPSVKNDLQNLKAGLAPFRDSRDRAKPNRRPAPGPDA
jgi:hypothetical protein